MSAETFGFQAVSFGWRLLWRLFPPCCMGCGAPGAEICEACLRSAERPVGKTCGRCGKTLTGAGVCPLCSGLETIWFERVRSGEPQAGHNAQFLQKRTVVGNQVPPLRPGLQIN